MNTQALLSARPEIEYPESDGQPMAENTLQFEWIVTIKGGLDAQCRHDPDVFVAGDLFWYPVEGDSTIRTAPDVFVVFGRSKGHRASYLQWLEGGIAPHVVFEIHSPSNRPAEMVRKFQFYEDYGVEEYYYYDPHRNEMSGWRRSDNKLKEIPRMDGWTSPRLGVRFELASGRLQIFGPDGTPFVTYVEVFEQLDKERQEKENERERAERLAAQLRALGVEPEA